MQRCVFLTRNHRSDMITQWFTGTGRVPGNGSVLTVNSRHRSRFIKLNNIRSYSMCSPVSSAYTRRYYDVIAFFITCVCCYNIQWMKSRTFSRHACRYARTFHTSRAHAVRAGNVRSWPLTYFVIWNQKLSVVESFSPHASSHLSRLPFKHDPLVHCMLGTRVLLHTTGTTSLG